jgi:hypothetical protein
MMDVGDVEEPLVIAYRLDLAPEPRAGAGRAGSVGDDLGIARRDAEPVRVLRGALHGHRP